MLGYLQKEIARDCKMSIHGEELKQVESLKSMISAVGKCDNETKKKDWDDKKFP